MNISTVKANVLLFFVALIWGFVIVAQRIGLNYVGPLLFRPIRHILLLIERSYNK